MRKPAAWAGLDGFDELLVRCGLESNGTPEFLANGALRYGLHGKIANCPAHRVEVTIDGDSGEIAVTGMVDEARLFGNKLRLTATITHAGRPPGLTITDTITNLSAEPGELELLYHINFGLPLLDARLRRSWCRSRSWPPATRWPWRTWPSGTSTGRKRPGLGEAVFLLRSGRRRRRPNAGAACIAAGDRG